MDHLDELEAEAIYIMREVAAQCEKPVMLYSIGKDSSVMLHLALKAFYPEKPPFPFLHVNTTWKFKEMIAFRDKVAEKYGIDFVIKLQRNTALRCWNISMRKVFVRESIPLTMEQPTRIL